MIAAKSKKKHDNIERQLDSMTMKKYNELMAQNRKKWNIDGSKDLSSRCSIDFCEATAILESLKLIILKYERYSYNQQKPNKIRIVSDSLTSLKWITGEYRIKNMNMRSIVHDIHWYREKMHKIGITISFQWVRSHRKTLGNEKADLLAKAGLYMAQDHVNKGTKIYCPWKHYHVRAAINKCKDFFHSAREKELNAAMTKTQFGTITKAYKQQQKTLLWNKQLRKLMPHLSRGEVHTLIGLKTGKMRFKGYLHKRFGLFTDAMCTRCHAEEANIEHYLGNDANNCKEQKAAQLRDEFRHHGSIIMAKEEEDNKDEWIYKNWKMNQDSKEIIQYVFPDKRLTIGTRAKLIKTVTKYARKAVKIFAGNQ